MAKQENIRKKHRWLWFFLGMAIYGLIFLGGAKYGLDYFWDYLEAYENARPHYAIDAYMDELSPEYICDRSEALIAQVDSNIQSQAQCRAVITEAINGPITFAKKSAECTETKMVYILRCDNRVIGQVETQAVGEPVMGFAPWEVTSDSFDLSYLLTDPVSTTVPEQFPVYVNDVLLDSRYLVGTPVEYTELEGLYESYDLPHIVSYEAGPFLGEVTLQVTDPEGTPVEITADTAFDPYLNNCTDEEIAQLDGLIETFVKRYIAFSSSRGDAAKSQFWLLQKYIVSDSELESRLRSAIDGMAFNQSRSDELASIITHYRIRLDETHYLWDITYLVDTLGRNGMVQTTTNVKIIIQQTDEGLKIERLIGY